MARTPTGQMLDEECGDQIVAGGSIREHIIAIEREAAQGASDDETFMENVREALANGYERCCAACGVGTAADNLDIHDKRCPEWAEWMA